MFSTVHDLDIRLDALFFQRFNCAHALLPRDQVVGSSVEQEGWGAEGAAEDVGVWGDGLDFCCGWEGSIGGVVGWTAEEEWNGLPAPDHVQYEAAAGIRQR